MVWAWIRFDLLGSQHSFPGGGLFRVHFLEFVQVLVTAGKWKCRFFYGQFFFLLRSLLEIFFSRNTAEY